MPTQEDIENQKRLLLEFRRALEHLLRQEAEQAGVITPGSASSIRKCRERITAIKQTLKRWIGFVEDLPNDFETDSEAYKLYMATLSIPGEVKRHSRPPLLRVNTGKKRAITSSAKAGQQLKQQQSRQILDKQEYVPSAQLDISNTIHSALGRASQADLIDLLSDPLLRKLEEELRMNAQIWQDAHTKKPEPHEIHAAIFFEQQTDKVKNLYNQAYTLSQAIEESTYLSERTNLSVEILLDKVKERTKIIEKVLSIIPDHEFSISISRSVNVVDQYVDKTINMLIEESSYLDISFNIHYLANSISELEKRLNGMVRYVAGILSNHTLNKEFLISSGENDDLNNMEFLN